MEEDLALAASHTSKMKIFNAFLSGTYSHLYKLYHALSNNKNGIEPNKKKEHLWEVPNIKKKKKSIESLTKNVSVCSI